MANVKELGGFVPARTQSERIQSALFRIPILTGSYFRTCLS